MQQLPWIGPTILTPTFTDESTAWRGHLLKATHTVNDRPGILRRLQICVVSVSKPCSTRENVLFATPNNEFMMDHEGLQYSTECLFVFKLTLLIVWFLDMCTLGRAKMRENACPRKIATGPVEPVPGKAGDTITLLKHLGSPPALCLSQFTNSIYSLAYSPTVSHQTAGSTKTGSPCT